MPFLLTSSKKQVQSLCAGAAPFFGRQAGFTFQFISVVTHRSQGRRRTDSQNTSLLFNDFPSFHLLLYPAVFLRIVTKADNCTVFDLCLSVQKGAPPYEKQMHA